MISKKGKTKKIDIWEVDKIAEVFDSEVTFYNKTPIYFKKSDKPEIECPVGWEPIIEDFNNIKIFWGFRLKKQ